MDSLEFCFRSVASCCPLSAYNCRWRVFNQPLLKLKQLPQQSVKPAKVCRLDFKGIICLLFFFFPHSFNCAALIHPIKQMCKLGYLWEMLGGQYCRMAESWKDFADRESRKLCGSWVANAWIRSELQMCILALSSSVALLGTPGRVSIFLLLWSSEIKHLPLLKLTALLLRSVLPFQQGYSGPVEIDTISSLWMSKPGWFSASFCNWVSV